MPYAYLLLCGCHDNVDKTYVQNFRYLREAKADAAAWLLACQPPVTGLSWYRIELLGLVEEVKWLSSRSAKTGAFSVITRINLSRSARLAVVLDHPPPLIFRRFP